MGEQVQNAFHHVVRHNKERDGWRRQGWLRMLLRLQRSCALLHSLSKNRLSTSLNSGSSYSYSSGKSSSKSCEWPRLRLAKPHGTI